MEIGLGERKKSRNVSTKNVLILVLVEIGLGVNEEGDIEERLIESLNPCFSGNRFGSCTY